VFEVLCLLLSMARSISRAGLHGYAIKEEVIEEEQKRFLTTC